MSKEKETAAKDKPKGPVKYQVKFLRSHRKYHRGDVAVFTEEKAGPYIQEVNEGGAFAEVIQVMED
jgi:hypothetical protein